MTPKPKIRGRELESKDKYKSYIRNRFRALKPHLETNILYEN